VGVDALSEPALPVSRVVIVGGAGFIGSHFTDHLLGDENVAAVTIYDNFSSGRRWHLVTHDGDPRLNVVEADVADLAELTRAMAGHDAVIHLASNPDIARAAVEPSIDFDQGTLLTHNVVEAARRAGVGTLMYASGSGVYGDLGTLEVDEDHGPLLPISTYGASKLAGEALISSYSHMFGLRGRAFRFGNVVGPRQTHGVGYDFVRRLLARPAELPILGDGTQSKSYIHVDDVVAAVLTSLRDERAAYRVYNVATGDYITVTEIAELALECAGLEPGSVRFVYSGGDRGWKGDIPVVRLSTARMRALGWANRRSSMEALRDSMLAMVPDALAGRL
jgi:UDP-glucose 4-epimerase